MSFECGEAERRDDVDDADSPAARPGAVPTRPTIRRLFTSELPKASLERPIRKPGSERRKDPSNKGKSEEKVKKMCQESLIRRRSVRTRDEFSFSLPLSSPGRKAGEAERSAAG